MSQLKVVALAKSFSGKVPVVAVDAASFEVRKGELLVLLGPSGCGKTTILRCIAGLERADSGRIQFGERVIFDASQALDVPSERRAVGLVFQSYALWPHMTVRENIAFPLQARRLREGLESGWVEEVARLVGMERHLGAYPGNLSGGQQQRVALARALVSRPPIVLFDEPLSNLDARLRDQVRSDLRELHQRLGFTGVYVTHDQTEAVALGDRVAVMRAGVFEQLGTPREVFEHPATEFVADFIGVRNRIVLTKSDGTWEAAGVPLEGDMPIADSNIVETALRARPERIRLLTRQGNGDEGLLIRNAVVTSVVYSASHTDCKLRVGDTQLEVHLPIDEERRAEEIAVGKRVSVRFRKEHSLFYGLDGRLLDFRFDGAAESDKTEATYRAFQS